MNDGINDWHNPEAPPAARSAEAERTRAFLAEQPERGHFLRRFYANRGRRHDIDEPCELIGVQPDDAEALLELGFRPLRKVHQQIGRVQIDVERWIGPDGAILLETSDRGQQFMFAMFENGGKVSMTQRTPIGLLSKVTQFPHRYIFRSDDLAADYKRMADEVRRYAAKHDTRPLMRTDPELDELVWKYYDQHVVSLGHIAFAYLGPFIGVGLGVLIWLFLEAIGAVGG